MLHQYLVILREADGTSATVPLVCSPIEVMRRARALLDDSGAQTAEVLQGVDHIYTLAASDS